MKKERKKCVIFYVLNWLEKDKKSQVNNNYPFAYYDPTNTDKLNSIEELKKKNSLSDNALSLGQSLIIK